MNTLIPINVSVSVMVAGRIAVIDTLGTEYYLGFLGTILKRL